MSDGAHVLIATVDDYQLSIDGTRDERVADGAALRRRLGEEWGVALVVVDLRLADAALLETLQRTGAPPAIFLVDDAAGAHGINLAPNILDYLPVATGAEVLEDAIRRALAAAPRRFEVGDFSDRDSARLNALGAEVERIARALSELATENRQDAADTSTVTAPFVRAILKRRRDRERFFPAELFSDPAWDMLLDLTAARLERRLVAVSSLCIAAAVPTTTALRWIRNLCEIGMFERQTDPDDARRGLISLTPTTATRMVAYLAGLRGASPV